MDETIVQVSELRKVYGTLVAVAGISFQVRRGEIFGVLGPNGAGKTTSLECLEGLRCPDGGWVRILGIDPSREPRKLWNRIGIQLQTSGLPGDMRVGEAMRFFSAYHGAAPRYDLLERLGLQPKMNAQYRELSVGLQRRLALALAVAHDPAVVVLDEPTSGLDVNSRAELHELIDELRRAGTTLILATHDMAEAEKMADRVAILLAGKIVATGTPRELTATGAAWTKVSVRTEGACLSKNDTAFPAVNRRLLQEDYTVYFTTDPGPTVAAIIAHIDAQGDRLIDLRVERPSLEERFLEITRNGGVQ